MISTYKLPVQPSDQPLCCIYPEERNMGIELELGSLSFTPALIASLEVYKVIKILLSKEVHMRNKIAYVDLMNNDVSFI